MPAESGHAGGGVRGSGVQHRQVQRVGLAAQVRRPPVHLRRGEFRLSARAPQPGIALGVRAVDEHHRPASDPVPREGVPRRARPHRRVQHRYGDPVVVAGEARDPRVERPRLEALAAAEARDDLRLRGDADRVELVAPDPRQPERGEAPDQRRLARARGAGDDQDRGRRCGGSSAHDVCAAWMLARQLTPSLLRAVVLSRRTT